MKFLKIDLSQKNAAISIIFTLEVVYFAVWLLLGLPGRHDPMDDKIWGLLMGVHSALFLILNTEAKKEAGMDSPQNENPTQPQEGQTK